MSSNTFEKLEQTNKALYGPKAVLVCGFSCGQQQKITDFIRSLGLLDVPVIFPQKNDGQCFLKDLVARADESKTPPGSEMECAIIVSGITEQDLHRILSGYKDLGLPRPLWATLTPYSENWALADLIGELKKEREAMEASQKP
jgi:hypothetical protein